VITIARIDGLPTRCNPPLADGALVGEPPVAPGLLALASIMTGTSASAQPLALHPEKMNPTRPCLPGFADDIALKIVAGE
jgi:hypothetical protein